MVEAFAEAELLGRDRGSGKGKSNDGCDNKCQDGSRKKGRKGDRPNSVSTDEEVMANMAVTAAAFATRKDSLRSFASLVISRYGFKSTETHKQMIKRLSRYLRGSVSLDLVYKGPLDKLSGFSDADWAGDADTRRSTSDYIFNVGSGAISWSSERQQPVALSGTFSLSTRGRVILSGSALKSPELRMNSGIGDPAVLTDLSKADRLGSLPASQYINNTAVGAGLFDTPNTFIKFSFPDTKAYNYSYECRIPSDASLYLDKNSGLYSFAGGSCSF